MIENEVIEEIRRLTDGTFIPENANKTLIMWCPIFDLQGRPLNADPNITKGTIEVSGVVYSVRKSGWKVYIRESGNLDEPETILDLTPDYVKEHEKLYVKVYSRVDFVKVIDGILKENPDVAVISIENPGDKDKHYLQSGPNVLNLEFPDSDPAITIEEADKIVNFIEEHIGQPFVIHCQAGISRSQAIGEFILTEYGYSGRPALTPNIDVITKLRRVLYKRDGLWETS